MDRSSLIVGIVVLVAVVVLEFRNRLALRIEPDSELDEDYYGRRYRRRRLVHLLLVIVGALALLAGAIGRGGAFALIWAAVPLLIFIVVLLALADAYQTFRYHDEKLPELKETSLGGIDVNLSEPKSE